MKDKKPTKRMCSVLAVLLAFCLLFTGCVNGDVIEISEEDASDKGVESGFFISYGLYETPFCAAYKSEKSEFDINDVTLDFFWGGKVTQYMIDEYRYSYFDLYFVSDSEEGEGWEEFFVKRIEENFVSEKYRCEFTRVEGKEGVESIKYHYSEKITIPKEIFTGKCDFIWFKIKSINEIAPNQSKETSIANIIIYYKLTDDGKVILSGLPFH